uniref:Protein E7 n=1 Tax=Human papillomavirus TaxID=10566 RepID=A0A385PS52_9PAPI|nr:MAG: E7 protein [Human papillomavirus]
MREQDSSAMLKNILIEEEPYIVDLHCYEEVALSDEEEEPQQVQQSYLVTVQCAHCLKEVTFNYLADLAAIRQLQQRLFDFLFFCDSCGAVQQ